jgi:hypothetical protein
MKPFAINHRQSANSRIDLSFLLDRPAGKHGFVTIRDGQLVRPDGERLRLWGVNITDWSPGSVMLPSHEDARIYAAALARFGINCARLHFLDLPAPRGLIDDTRHDSQRLDPDQLDRLDYWVAQLKQHGIYSDLNLAVGRTYKAGDGVQDHDQIGWAKAITYFDPRLIELQKAYAAQLLTHYNPYTGSEYRHEPAIVIVELVNENSLVEAWCRGRLHPSDQPSSDPNWRSIPASYAEMLDQRYDAYLARQPSDTQELVRAQAGVAGNGRAPRLRAEELASAPGERFHAEASFYMEIERDYFREMQTFLKDELGVRSLLIGSSDHAHDQSNYPMLWANALLDILDGHVYWQPPGVATSPNTPMVNDPLFSTVVQLSRTAMAGKPYTVSEVNHPFPHDWACEGIPILAAYARLQDWDAVMWYAFEPKAASNWEPSIGDPFDISLDAVKMPQLAAGALLFLRGDVSAARTTVERTYTLEQARESLRLPGGERPYYTPGFPLALALQHKIRIGSLEGPPTAPICAPQVNPIVSDTHELAWYTSPGGQSLVSLDTPCSQALIGFLTANRQAVRHLAADLANQFCAITLSALDGLPIARSARMLVTAGARVQNTGQRWNEPRTALLEQGGPPSLIEPVSGRLFLRNLEQDCVILVQPLDGAGQPLGEPIPATRTRAGWEIAIGNPATTWYEIAVKHAG